MPFETVKTGSSLLPEFKWVTLHCELCETRLLLFCCEIMDFHCIILELQLKPWPYLECVGLTRRQISWFQALNEEVFFFSCHAL